jgi:GH24 family phage-related lysozyme (muramidase)
MTYIERMYERLRREEGFRGRPYRDTHGHTTVLFGHNLDAAPLCREAGEAQLHFDVARAIEDADDYSWFAGLSDARKQVIVEMIYQMGPGGFHLFRGLRRALEAGSYAAAAEAIRDSDFWRSETHKRAEELAIAMERDEAPA